MSAINIFLSPERALVGVDTDATVESSGAHTSISKMIALPHANIVLAGRGTTIGFASAISASLQNLAIQDFDSALALMPKMLGTIFQSLEKLVSERLNTAALDLLQEQQIVIVGWSHSAGRIRAVEFMSSTIATGFKEKELMDPGFACPWEEGMNLPEDPPHDVATQLELLRAQVQHVRGIYGKRKPIGGRLVVAEVTKESIVFSIHDLPRPTARTIQEMVVTQRPCPTAA